MLALQIAVVVLTVSVLGIGFLLLGVLRRVEHLNWQFETFRATQPRRIGRDGLGPGVRGECPQFRGHFYLGSQVSDDCQKCKNGY